MEEVAVRREEKVVEVAVSDSEEVRYYTVAGWGSRESN